MTVGALERLLRQALRDGERTGWILEGVTIQGGEPFDQAMAVADLARIVHHLGLGLMVFTGFLIEDLKRGIRPGSGALLQQTDLLVDGPYRRDLPSDGRPWIGSPNQRFHFLSSRYESLRDGLAAFRNSIEIRFDGRAMTWNGFPSMIRTFTEVLR